MITGKARIAGVIGWPVAHSLSPLLHNYWLESYGIDGAYIPLPVEPQKLPSVLPALRDMGFAGVNLTLPHKELAFSLVDELDDAAKHIGAVNTIVIREGRLLGRNTDAEGFWLNIEKQAGEKRGRAVVLGAGGAARAVVYALSQAGFADIIITNRSEEKASQLARSMPHCSHCLWEHKESALHTADLLVNATSLGMQGKETLTLSLDALPKHALVTDIVYTPLETPLLRAAKARGNPTVDGLGMLLHQAVPGFEAWFGVRPQVTDKLREYILSRLC